MEIALSVLNTTDVLKQSLSAIERLREEGARVHSITNTVAQNFTANVLLACNAKPSMTANVSEVEFFTRRADALHINLGTLDDQRKAAIEKSMKIARSENKPILLDPVMVHVSPERAKFAQKLCQEVSILKGNSQEVETLDVSARAVNCVLQSGETDCAYNSELGFEIDNGHPIMGQVIATGCALGALVAALSSKTENPIVASVAGAVWFGVAGEEAAKRANGPGSFPVEFLDELANITASEIIKKARIT